MKPLFGAQGQRALVAVLRGQPLLAFDFDGTLAPLVDRPEQARVPAALARRLARLATLRPVAIVTGRAVADVTGRLGFTPGFVVGNHGAEFPGAPPVHDAAALDPLRRRFQAAAAIAATAGMQLEDKHYSLTVHFRRAPDQAAARALADALVADLPPGLRMVPGSMVRNVVLAQAPDKGDAVLALVARAACDRAVFLGDDDNDESVFTKAPAGWLTARVATDARSAAGYYLGDYASVPALLDRMLDLLGGGAA